MGSPELSGAFSGSFAGEPQGHARGRQTRPLALPLPPREAGAAWAPAPESHVDFSRWQPGQQVSRAGSVKPRWRRTPTRKEAPWATKHRSADCCETRDSAEGGTPCAPRASDCKVTYANSINTFTHSACSQPRCLLAAHTSRPCDSASARAHMLTQSSKESPLMRGRCKNQVCVLHTIEWVIQEAPLRVLK